MCRRTRENSPTTSAISRLNLEEFPKFEARGGA